MIIVILLVLLNQHFERPCPRAMIGKATCWQSKSLRFLTPSRHNWQREDFISNTFFFFLRR